VTRYAEIVPRETVGVPPTAKSAWSLIHRLRALGLSVMLEDETGIQNSGNIAPALPSSPYTSSLERSSTPAADPVSGRPAIGRENMGAFGPRRHIFQFRSTGVQNEQGAVQYLAVDAREAVARAAAGLARVASADGDVRAWRVTLAPAPHPSQPNQFYALAEARYGAGCLLRLGCVGSYAQVSYPNFQGTETLLSVNFEDSSGWQTPYAQWLVDTTVNVLWECLEEWRGQGQVMWEEQSAR
jgi:hypothetical protein